MKKKFLFLFAFLFSFVSINAAQVAFREKNTPSFDVYADLLFWFAKESGTENWAEVITTEPGSLVLCDIRSVDFEWDLGFRVGFGYNMKNADWGTELFYTRFHTNGSDQVFSIPGSVYSAFLGNFYVDNPTGAGIKGLTYQSASISWIIDFNIFDWQVTRSFQLSKAIQVKPFIGLKGGWINQSIHTVWRNPTVPVGSDPFNIGIENLKNNFIGIGPSFGINMNWNLCAFKNHHLSLFGDFSGSMMYGHWTFGDHYSNDIQQEITINLQNLNSSASMIRTFMGFRWDICRAGENFYFYTKLGFEMQFWLNQLQYYTLDTGRLNNLFSLQGGSLEFCFEF